MGYSDEQQRWENWLRMGKHFTLSDIIEDYQKREERVEISKVKNHIKDTISRLVDGLRDIERDLDDVKMEYYYYDRMKFISRYAKEKVDSVLATDDETLKTLVVQMALFGQIVTDISKEYENEKIIDRKRYERERPS